MSRRFIILTIGIISLLISISTWTVDLLGLVDECVYCRTERTIIGILGLLFLIPRARYLRSYLSFIFGFFGAHIATDQIFIHIQNETLGVMPILAACALFIMIGQVWMLHYLEFNDAQRR